MGSVGRKTLTDGGSEFIIRSDEAPVVFSDFLTEYRTMNGVVYVSFGSVSQDSSNQMEVDILCRLRMNIVTAQVLRDLLTNIINDATKPVDTTKTN